MTQQHNKDDVDINNIVKKYVKTGVITHINANAGQYADYSDVTCLEDALHKINGAQDMFNQLPATVRDKFKNDPFAFVEYAAGATTEQMQELGLIERPDQPTSPEVPGTTENNKSEADAPPTP